MKPPYPPQKPPEQSKAAHEEDLPVVVSFALHKKSTRWTAVALETQGMRVLRVRVLEADPDRAHVTFCLERARHVFYSYGESPFALDAQ